LNKHRDCPILFPYQDSAIVFASAEILFALDNIHSPYKTIIMITLRLFALSCALSVLSFSASAQQPCALCGTTASEWVEAITIDGYSGTFLNPPGGGAGGCVDKLVLDAYVAVLKKGVYHKFTLTPGFSGTAQSEYWKIWIDLNHDGDLNDPGDLVFASLGGSSTTVQDSFFIPLSVVEGPSIMRVAMRRGSLPPDCGNFTKGQVLTYNSVYVDECNISFTNACAREYIQQVNVNTINNVSSCGASGYQDFTNFSSTLRGGTGYPVNLTPGFFGPGQHPERWLIWIDFNNDFDFDDPGEKVFDSGVIGSALSIVGNITIPPSAKTATTRMRIKMIPTDVNTVTLDPCDPVPSIWFEPDQYGEAEDYTVNIQETLPCEAVIIPTLNCINQTIDLEAYISWIFTGTLDPIVVNWSNGQSGHKITVSPSGIWTFDDSGLGCYFQVQPYSADNSIFIYPDSPLAISPVNGETGINPNALLQWSNVDGANLYFIEVATDLLFSTGWHSISTNATSTTLDNLQPNTVYYWRIRANNHCGTTDFSSINAFQTGVPECNQNFNSTDVPQYIYIVLDGSGTTSAVSNLIIPQNKTILDINLSLSFDHTYTGDLSASLISADNESVLLFDRPGVPNDVYGCPNDNGILSFDNQAGQTAAVLEAQCNSLPPALNGTFQPIGNIAALNGKNSLGQWQLVIVDHYAEEDSGVLNSWSLNFCFSTAIAPGSIIVNNPLNIGFSQNGIISQNLLSMAFSNLSVQGVYTLLNVPQYGTLKLNGIPLGLGGLFTQEDINTGKLMYLHNGDAVTKDSFHFDAIDQNNNAWVHDAVFNININPNNLAATAVQTQGILCHNSISGVITVTASGLNGVYTYGLNGGSSQNNNVFSGLSAGTYTVVVTGQFGNTVSTFPITLANPPALSLNTSVACDDVTIAASGGTGMLAYSINGINFQNGNQFFNLPNGTYTVTVRDANGCTASKLISIANTLMVTVQINQPSCFGINNGNIIVTLTGGQTPFTYSLNGGPNQGSNTFNNLSAGSYTVIVTDNNGCSVTSNTLLLMNPAPIQILTNATQSTITVQASGGTGFLSYSINSVFFQSQNQFFNVPNGIYTVTVRDDNGCTATAQATVNALIATTQVSPILCFGGFATVTVNASGGTLPYQYQLGNGSFQTSNIFGGLGAGTYTIHVKDASNLTVTITLAPITITQASPLNLTVTLNCNDATLAISGGTPPYSSNPPEASLKNLPNGSYQVTVTDDHGCATSNAFQVNVPQLDFSFTTVDVLCNEGNTGSITANGFGGCPTYQYSLSGSPFMTNNTFSNLSTGSYSLAVKDAKANIYFEFVTVFQPSLLSVSAVANGNTITATASGGVLPYSYSLNGGLAQSSGVFTNLASGKDTVVVTDGNGCTAVTYLTVGTIDTAEEWGATLSPNPGSGLFRLTLQNAPELLFAQVFELSGRLLESFDFEPMNGNLETTLDLHGLPNGTYLLLLSDGERWGSMYLSKAGK